MEHKAKTDVLEFDLTQIPTESLVRIGAIFKEGELKYGLNNWRNGAFDRQFQRERANHALHHLMLSIDSLFNNTLSREDDLAKVAWYCVTQMELVRMELEQGSEGS